MTNDEKYELHVHCVVIVIGEITAQRMKAIREPFNEVEPEWIKIYAVTQQASNPVNGAEYLPIDSKKLCLNKHNIPSAGTLHYLQHCLKDVFRHTDFILLLPDLRVASNLVLVTCLGYLLSTKTISRQALTIALVNEPAGFEALQHRLQFDQGRRLLHQYCDNVIINRTELTQQSVQQSRPCLKDYFWQEEQNMAAILKLFAEYIWGYTLIGTDFAWIADALRGQGESVFASVTERGSDNVQQATEKCLETIRRALDCSLIDDTITSVFVAIYGELVLTHLSIATEIVSSYFNPDIQIFLNLFINHHITDENELEIAVLVVKQYDKK